MISKGEFNSLEVRDAPFLQVVKRIGEMKPESIYVFLTKGNIGSKVNEYIKEGFVSAQETLILKRNLNKKEDKTPLNLATSRHGVLAMVLNQEKDSILLVKERGRVKMPSGTTELGEMPEATVCRELDEELDIKVSHINEIGSMMSFKCVKGVYDDDCRIFSCVIDKDVKPRVKDGEVDAWKWVKVTDIATSDASEITRLIVTNYLKRPEYPLTFYKNNKRFTFY